MQQDGLAGLVRRLGELDAPLASLRPPGSRVRSSWINRNGRATAPKKDEIVAMHDHVVALVERFRRNPHEPLGDGLAVGSLHVDRVAFDEGRR